MDIKILELDHGISYGSVTLKSLQNEYIPKLDLLVREAIQNSSDASLGSSDERLRVGFKTGFFQPEEFNSYVTDLEEQLNKEYGDTKAKFLEIRDTKTCGLTGPIRMSDIKGDDHGNFFKLIFDTGKKQTISGSGGNWGFGKSVYYQIGIGLVIFYSQVKTNGGFESRLIMTLVEDETLKNPDGSDATLLKALNNRSVGKAWWGIREGNDLLPITDTEFIKSMLNIFGIKEFSEGETGTSIIIPYINPQKLLSDVVPHESEIKEDLSEQFKSTWANDIESYLNLSIQRWYAPKIHNRELIKIDNEKKWLHVTVNDKPVKKADLIPFFDLVQELYNTALAKIKNVDYDIKSDYEITTHAINIRNYLSGGSTAGYVAVSKISKQKLKGNNLWFSPYVYTGHFEAEGGQNEPIVMYTREPGMVIEYSCSGPWVKGISCPESEDDFIFAFFVPDTDKKLKADLPVHRYAGITLGEYLKYCEASDHMGWSDSAEMSVVEKIRKNTTNQICQRQKKDEESHIEATASRLSGKLGRILMPRIGYETPAKTKMGSGGSGGGGGSGKNFSYEFFDQKITGNDIEVKYDIKLINSKRSVTIEIIIASEGGRIDPDAWQRDIGTTFPAIIVKNEFSVRFSGINQGQENIEGSCTCENPEFCGETVEASIRSAEGSAEYTSVVLKSKIAATEFSGTLKIHAVDKKYIFYFKVS